MALKFDKTIGWIALETAMEGSKSCLKEAIRILNHRKFSAYIDKHSKTRYDIIINSKKQCELQIYKQNHKKFIHLKFYSGTESKNVDNLDELRAILGNWANNFELIKSIKGYKNVPLRKGKYNIQDVLTKRNHLPRFEDEVDFDGDLIHMNSLRYHTFAEKGVKCVCCGIEGQYFTKDYGNGRYHFNLYAINKDGREILMTKDHIFPKSLGGKDELGNMQTMCIICNERKGNSIEELRKI